MDPIDIVVGLVTGRPCIEQLEILRIAWRLDTDPTWWPHGSGMAAGDEADLCLPLWTIDTRYWACATIEQFAEISQQARVEQEQFQLRHDFTHDGQPLQVQTDFCAGLDLNTDRPGEPPLLFETMIVDGRHQPFGRSWRYATAAAARVGHAAIVDALA